MTNSSEIERHLPLRPVELQILLCLADGPLHGYGILRAAEVRSGGAVRLEVGTLYRALRRLQSNELICEADRPADELEDDERRRYFAMTEFGRAVAAAEANRMAGLVRWAAEGQLVKSPASID